MEKVMLFIGWVLPVLGGAFVGSYLATYLKEKGRNLATHEDIDKLVDQVRAVTTTTKEIEAKISNEVWDRQKRWELKREVIFAMTRSIAEADNALMELHATLKSERVTDEATWAEHYFERLKKWTAASAAFQASHMSVVIICSYETSSAVGELGALMLPLAAKMTASKDAELYDKSHHELAAKLMKVRAALRKELGIEPLSKPQSGISSAAQTPGS